MLLVLHTPLLASTWLTQVRNSSWIFGGRGSLQGCSLHQRLHRPSWAVLLPPEHPVDDLFVVPAAPLGPLGHKHLVSQGCVTSRHVCRRARQDSLQDMVPHPVSLFPRIESRKCLGKYLLTSGFLNPKACPKTQREEESNTRGKWDERRLW